MPHSGQCLWPWNTRDRQRGHALSSSAALQYSQCLWVATPGVYPLTTGLPGQTVTLYDDDTGTNFIATRGQVEILTVTALELTGRIAVAYDADNYVNGNFTIAHCP